MSKSQVIMGEFAKLFNVDDGDGSVLVYFEHDKQHNAYFGVVMTEIDEERFVTETKYHTREDAKVFLNTFLQGQAEFYYANTKEHRENVPSFSLNFLLDMDYDTFCDWVESQDLHNLKVMKMVMEKNPRFDVYVKVVDVYLSKLAK